MPNLQNRGMNETARTDGELARAARRGDKRAFVEIVARHQAMVCGVALGILGDFAASEDAAQEAFLTAWRKFHELREPERVKAWLAQIARNAALGHLRRQRGHEELDENLSMADEAPTPDETAATEEEAALVRDSLAKLPEAYRLPLVLYYREGNSVRAVAEALEISEDAVKQRLARGREMLRERMSGLVESVLAKAKPTAVFTMTIAAAIGALAAPSAIAASAFAATSSTAAAGSSGGITTSFLTAMSTAKNLLITAGMVTAVCIPVGYQVAEWSGMSKKNQVSEAQRATEKSIAPPTFGNSALFAEWRALHERYGNGAEAMPALYGAISEIKDSFRRRAFRAALISEWVQVDPRGGLPFFFEKGRDSAQRRQFFEEWMSLNAADAVSALIDAGQGWDEIARELLPEIARRVPERVAGIAAKLPGPHDNYWDTNVREAFAIMAENDFDSARKMAEAMTGPSRTQALSGISKVWGKRDSDAAMAWAKSLPDGTDRDEVIRVALLGKAVVDPTGALEMAGIVPSGTRQTYFASSTGARVLSEAAKTDFNATILWIAEHPQRFSREDMMGLVSAVTEQMNTDVGGFLNSRAADGSLAAITPAIGNALLNNAAGARGAVWEWLKKQDDTDAVRALRQDVLNSAGYQDPDLAMRLVADLPQTKEGESELKDLARSLLNGGSMMHRLDSLMAQAPERLKGPLLESAFSFLNSNRDSLDDPQRWIARLAQLPETARESAVGSLARAWAGQSPDEALHWAGSLPNGDQRGQALAAVAQSWGKKDAEAAAEWVAALPAGAERDRSAAGLASGLAENHPREAWKWAMSIQNETDRARAAMDAVGVMARRDLPTARQWVESGGFEPQARAELEKAMGLTTGFTRIRP